MKAITIVRWRRVRWPYRSNLGLASLGDFRLALPTI